MSKKPIRTKASEEDKLTSQRRVALLIWAVFVVFAAYSLWNGEWGIGILSAMAAALAFIFSRPPVKR
jgi:uncharacterized membrane protein